MTVIQAVEAVDEKQMNFMDDNLLKGCEIFLKDEEAKDFFVEFLMRSNWKDQLTKTETWSNTLTKEVGSIDISSSNFYDLVVSSNPQSQNELTNNPIEIDDVRREECQEPASEYPFRIQRKIRTILLASVFPIFLKSTQYRAFIEMKSYESDVLIYEKKYPNEEKSTREERLDLMFAKVPVFNTKDVIANAVASVDDIEAKMLLSSGQWIYSVFSAVEDLPISFSIATARSDRRGFPLIYVNKAFEKTTGYSRSKIVGQNCRFLQSENTEKDLIDLMVTSLSSAQPVKVGLTNRRRDGTGSFIVSICFLSISMKYFY